MECKQSRVIYNQQVLTDVLLFTHLLHLPQRHMRQNHTIVFSYIARYDDYQPWAVSINKSYW